MVSNSFLWIQTGHGALAGLQLIFWDGSVNFCGLQMIPSDLLGALHPNQWLQPAVKPLQMHHHLLSLWRNDSSNKIKQRIKVIVVMEISKNPMANTKCPCSSPQINHDLILNTMIYPKSVLQLHWWCYPALYLASLSSRRSSKERIELYHIWRIHGASKCLPWNSQIFQKPSTAWKTPEIWHKTHEEMNQGKLNKMLYFFLQILPLSPLCFLLISVTLSKQNLSSFVINQRPHR